MVALACPEIAAIEETGSLGVVYLKRLWSQWKMPIPATIHDQTVRDWRATHVLCSGLGIGLHETLRYVLAEQPSFEQFEEWVRALNGGQLDGRVVARMNAALMGQPVPSETRAWLDAVDAAPPVLSDEDMEQWRQEGWVVLHDAIDPEACRATAESIWQAQGMSPDDPDGWGYGPLQECVFVQAFHHPVQQANRHSPRIHKAYAQVWGTADLWPTTDRVGFNPPVRPGRPFPGPGIHWDVSLVPPVLFGVQGIIYLTDTAADQGAFALVPGMHRQIDQWVAALPPDVDPNHRAAQTMTMTPIAGRAGDMILWHQALPHGPTPNLSDQPRLVQYLTMFPADFGYEPRWR